MEKNKKIYNDFMKVKKSETWGFMNTKEEKDWFENEWKKALDNGCLN